MDNDLISRSAVMAKMRVEKRGYKPKWINPTWVVDAEAIKNAPAIDAVPVVRCIECVLHGNCRIEAAFRIKRIENPYCCGGKRREEE